MKHEERFGLYVHQHIYQLIKGQCRPLYNRVLMSCTCKPGSNGAIYRSSHTHNDMCDIGSLVCEDVSILNAEPQNITAELRLCLFVRRQSDLEMLTC